MSATTALTGLLGLGLLASPAQATQHIVENEGDLRYAITNAQDGDSIYIVLNITLTENLPVITKNLTIHGDKFYGTTISGDGKYRGLFVQSGTVNLQDLNITNSVAQGGAGGNGWGGGGGGGGAGLGGALYVGNGAHVTLDSVNLIKNSARGGAGGSSEGGYTWTSGGGGGYYPTGADGGNANGFTSGGGGTGGGGDGYDNDYGDDGAFGGGGGGSGQWDGGKGGFGGGGGGSAFNTNAEGGFLGGNGAPGADYVGGIGKFGGGGGGGAGLGGGLFIENGGTLTVVGGFEASGNAAVAGAGGMGGWNGTYKADSGSAAGDGIFLAGNGTLVFKSNTFQTFVIPDSIADQTGLGGEGAEAGSWGLVLDSSSELRLTGVNNYTGGTTVNAGVLIGNTDSLKYNVFVNAHVIFDQKVDGTYTGLLAGAGLFEKEGAGNLILTGENRLTGNINVLQGNLLFDSDANLGTSTSPIRLIGGGGDGGVGVVAANGQAISRALRLEGGGRIHVGEGQTTGLEQLSWNGTISGNGRLTVNGGGILELTADNSYTGGTRITGDSYYHSTTLRFTTDSNLGAAGGGVLLNNGIIATTNDAADGLSIHRALYLEGDGTIEVGLRPLIWSGDINGGGRLIKSGAGVLQLTGNNSHSGGTEIWGGVLQVASDDKLGAAGAGIAMGNNGLLRASESFTTARPIRLEGGGGGFLLDTGTTLTLTGTVAGEGTLSLVGTGTLVLNLTSANYTGVYNYGGTIQADSKFLNGNIAFDTNPQNSNARTILFDQTEDGVFAGNIGGIGEVQGLGNIIKLGAGKLTLSGTSNYKSQDAEVSAEVTILQGTLQGTTNNLQGAILNNAALIFDQDFDGSYAGHMSGTGTLTKNGTGKLNLTGNSRVGGGTTINAGTLAVNGPLISDIVLNAGGTLSGVGNIKGDITNNGGSIRPGNSIGHLVFDGNFALNSGTLGIEINAGGNSDRISVIGAGHRVNIDAGMLEITADPGRYIPNTRYTIISTEGGGRVHFDQVVGGVGFLTPKVSLDANNIYVTLALAPDAFSAAGQTRNQQAVGAALDAAAASGNVGGIVTTMANLQTAQGAAALQTLSGQPYADWATVNLRASQLFTSTVGQQMSIARSGSSGGNRAALAEPGSDTLAGVSMWISGVGSRGSVDGDGNAAGHDTSLGGVTVGFDYRLNPGLLVGVAGGYVSGSQSVDGFSGDTDAETLSIAAYGSFGQGALHVEALAGYANARNSLKRDVASAGLAAGRAKGEGRADQFLGQLEAGYRIALGASEKSAITPFGRLQILTNSQNSFTESGGGEYALAVESQSTTSVRSVLGGDFAAGFDLGKSTPVEVGLRLGWAHEFADTGRSMTAAFASAPGSAFTVQGASLPRDSALIGVSVAAKVSRTGSLFVSYEGEPGGGSSNNQFRGGIRLSW
ncbi:autotransporter domain-containing protein [Sandaracinobacter neustonicus]|uniref:Autotransporter domain-containing protein n=1 Tax=Sandaracinobacter neustonicus TaxID=1715348 RepID=A0A501XLR2_9SPHN|nr:autotransporter outer membrane beta-barrel domain-containing protein [Sandaracinobacter neustonicus]TPE61578.1 autotransporter domain-containing protein [Sandaracinobacter neustonicus]